MNKDEHLHDIKEKFLDDWSATSDVRDQANEEFRFVKVPGGQWEGWLESAYENRARLQIDHTSDYVARTKAQYLNGRRMPNFQPSDDATSDDDAELLDGLIRRDMQRNGGQSSVDTSVDEAFTCGMGAIVLNTAYDDPGDPENDDMSIVFTEQPNAYSTVVFDYGARRADKADAKHVTILTPYNRREFESRWPDANPSSVRVSDRASFNWSHGELFNVATFYEVKSRRTELQTWIEPKSGEMVIVDAVNLDTVRDEMELAGFQYARKRFVTRKSVMKTVFSGDEVLEKPTRIAGEYLPVIPCYAFRGYVDGAEYFHGLVRPRMDAQRILNMSFSLAAESAAHASDTKPLFTPEQMPPSLQSQWAENWHQNPYVLAEPLRDQNGNPMPLQPAMMPGTSVSPAVSQLIEMASQSLQIGTGGAPQDIADPDASGKAIQALIKRVDLNTQPIFDNIDKFIKRTGVVWESMAREVYTARKNRHIKIITEKGDAKSMNLMQPAGVNGQIVSTNDISRGKFDVVVGTSADYQTAKEETFEQMRDAVAVMPESSQWREPMLLQLIQMKDAPGMEDFQQSIKRHLLAGGFMRPESDEDKEYMAQLQQAAQGQTDPNAQMLEAMAQEQATQAQLNQAKIAQTGADAVKKAAEAEQIKIESARMVQDARQPVQ